MLELDKQLEDAVAGALGLSQGTYVSPEAVLGWIRLNSSINIANIELQCQMVLRRRKQAKRYLIPMMLEEIKLEQPGLVDIAYTTLRGFAGFSTNSFASGDQQFVFQDNHLIEVLAA